MKIWQSAVLAIMIVPSVSLSQRGHDGIYGGGAGGGTLTNGYSYYRFYSDSLVGKDRVWWLNGVILWKGEEGSMRGTPADSAVRHSMQATRRLADSLSASGSTAFATWAGSAVFLYRSDADRRRQVVEMLGKSYALPARDSAIVIMLDHVTTLSETPVVAGITYIGADAPQAIWPKMWTSGDTTFTYHARNSDQLFEAALRRSPQIESFLH